MQYPNSLPRASRIVALDRRAAEMLHAISEDPWKGARFLILSPVQPDLGAGRVRLTGPDGAALEAAAELEGADVVVLVATTGEGAAAAQDEVARNSGLQIDSERINKIADELTSVAAIVERMGTQRGNGRDAVVLPDGSDLERAIAAVWQDVLGLERVNLDDRYAEVGGTSLKAVQIVARLKRECGLSVGLVDLYEHPTIALLARRFGGGEEELDEAAKATRERGERRRQRLGGRRNRRQTADAD